MPRPPLPRRIPRGLTALAFKPRGIPMNKLTTLELTLDGLEALRLADREGLYQEEAAQRMGISRATFARIVAQARQTVAEAVLEGKALVVKGGTVKADDQRVWPCPIHGHRHRRGRGCRCGEGKTQGEYHGESNADGSHRQ